MNLDSVKHINSVLVIDASKWPKESVDSKIAELTKQKPEDALYLITTLSLESSVETYPEGQVLNIIINDIPNLPKKDVKNLFDSLGKLRDFYPDLTVKVIDKTDKISKIGLPEDTIVIKKAKI